MKTKIIQELNELQNQKKINILLAVESGSRVWGMESEDSDFDIRFVFSRTPHEYLSLDKPSDIIEITKDNRDYVGFDIFKFLNLLRNSNPTVIDWLKSDIIYVNKFKMFKELMNEVENNFNPLGLFQHYKSLCKNNYIKYLKESSDVRYKRYLYCFRGMCNSLFIYQYNKLPPIKLEDTLNKISKCISKNAISKISEIIKIKKTGFEKDNIKNIPLLDNTIEEFLKSQRQPSGRKKFDVTIFDKVLKRNIGI